MITAEQSVKMTSFQLFAAAKSDENVQVIGRLTGMDDYEFVAFQVFNAGTYNGYLCDHFLIFRSPTDHGASNLLWNGNSGFSDTMDELVENWQADRNAWEAVQSGDFFG